MGALAAGWPAGTASGSLHRHARRHRAPGPRGPRAAAAAPAARLPAGPGSDRWGGPAGTTVPACPVPASARRGGWVGPWQRLGARSRGDRAVGRGHGLDPVGQFCLPGPRLQQGSGRGVPEALDLQHGMRFSRGVVGRITCDADANTGQCRCRQPYGHTRHQPAAQVVVQPRAHHRPEFRPRRRPPVVAFAMPVARVRELAGRVVAIHLAAPIEAHFLHQPVGRVVHEACDIAVLVDEFLQPPGHVVAQLHAPARLHLLHHPAPEVVAVGDCRAGARGLARAFQHVVRAVGGRLQRAGGRPAVAHRRVARLLHAHQPQRAMLQHVVQLGALAQRVRRLQHLAPGAVAPGLAAAGAVDVPRELAAGVVGVEATPALRVDHRHGLVPPGERVRWEGDVAGSCAGGGILPGLFVFEAGGEDLGVRGSVPAPGWCHRHLHQPAPVVVAEVRAQPRRVLAGQQQAVLRAARRAPVLLRAAPVRALHTQQPARAVVAPPRRAAQRIGGREATAGAVVAVALFGPIRGHETHQALEAAFAFEVVGRGTAQAVVHQRAALAIAGQRRGGRSRAILVILRALGRLRGVRGWRRLRGCLAVLEEV